MAHHGQGSPFLFFSPSFSFYSSKKKKKKISFIGDDVSRFKGAQIDLLDLRRFSIRSFIFLITRQHVVHEFRYDTIIIIIVIIIIITINPFLLDSIIYYVKLFTSPTFSISLLHPTFYFPIFSPFSLLSSSVSRPQPTSTAFLRNRRKSLLCLVETSTTDLSFPFALFFFFSILDRYVQPPKYNTILLSSRPIKRS